MIVYIIYAKFLLKDPDLNMTGDQWKRRSVLAVAFITKWNEDCCYISHLSLFFIEIYLYKPVHKVFNFNTRDLASFTL